MYIYNVIQIIAKHESTSTSIKHTGISSAPSYHILLLYIKSKIQHIHGSGILVLNNQKKSLKHTLYLSIQTTVCQHIMGW